MGADRGSSTRVICAVVVANQPKHFDYGRMASLIVTRCNSIKFASRSKTSGRISFSNRSNGHGGRNKTDARISVVGSDSLAIVQQSMVGIGKSGAKLVSYLISTLKSSFKNNSAGSDLRIFHTLFQYVWPSHISLDSSNNNIEDEEEKKKELAVIQERKNRVMLSLGLLLAGKAVTIQVPFVFKYLVDSLPNSASLAGDVASSADLGIWPVALLLGYGAGRFASSAFHEWRNAVFMSVAQDAIRNTGRKLFDHIQNLDLQFHLSKNTGKVARIMDRGQRSIQVVLNAMVFHVAPTILEVSLVSGLLAWQFGIAHANVAILTVAAYGIFTVGVTQWRTQFRRDMNRLENQASTRLVDSLINYETVHYFNNVKHEGFRYEESLRGYQAAALQAQSSLSFLNVGQVSIFSVGLTSLMWLTAQQIINGSASVGDLVLVNGLLFQLSVPLFFIGSVYREVRQSLIDMEQMYDLMNTKSRLNKSQPQLIYHPESMGTELKMENVHFSYPLGFDPMGTTETAESADSYQPRLILQGTTLTVPQGSTVAVVGSSGCGKSTLLRLWYRFYDPSGGRVMVGGHDVRDYDLDSLRRKVAVIPQETVLFHESVLYNLQYGNLSASRDEIIYASQQAQLHDSIQRFPNGYETVVGERGLKLSGGEKQRLSIARALLKKDAPILLCDEPTSQLDSQTESQIMQSIKNIRRNKSGMTVVIIAHRLSTIQDSDIIMVMEKGRLVEQGTHAELLSLGSEGRYYELWKRQESMQEV